MTTLYIGDKAYSSWSLRAWLILRRAKIEFDTTLIRLDEPNTAAELAKVSPGRTVPVLHVGDEVVWDTLAIAEWAHERAPKAHLWPKSARVRAAARGATASMHAGFAALREAAPMNLHRIGKARDLGEAGERDAVALQALWLRAREAAGPVPEGRFLFGAWSIADAFATPYATRLRAYAQPVESDVAQYVHALLDDADFIDWERAAQADSRRLDHVDAI